MDYFETGYFGGGEGAWHGLGNVVAADVLTAADAIEQAGLDWEVVQIPLAAVVLDDGPLGMLNGDFTRYIAIPESVANVRATDRRVLGTVGKDYKLVQNRDAFTFMDKLLASEEAKYHTAGALKGGKRVWMLARMNRDIFIGGEPSEQIAPFILICNGHDGSMGLIVAVTPVRVVCWNTLSLALTSAQRTWYAKHTSKISDRMEIDAAQTLRLTYGFFDRLEEVGNALITQPFSTQDFERMLKRLIPMPKVIADKGGQAAKSRKQAREAILNIFKHEPNLQNIADTKWGAIQAVTQYEDHVQRVRASKEDKELDNALQLRRFERAVLSPNLKLKAMTFIAPEFVPAKFKGRIETEEAEFEEEEALVAAV